MALSAQIEKVVGAGAEQLVNYNFTDIAAGTGVVEFYGGRLGDNVKASYALLNNKFYSSRVLTDNDCASSAYVKYLDLDFDIEFNLPKTINGNVLVNIPVGAQGLDPTTLYMFPAVRIRKWDGTTETELGYASGGILYSPGLGDGDFIYGMGALGIPIINVNFKKGETLRVTAELWALNGLGTPAQQIFIGHDPQGRATSGYETTPTGNPQLTFGTTPSVFTVQVPFKLNI